MLEMKYLSIHPMLFSHMQEFRSPTKGCFYWPFWMEEIMTVYVSIYIMMPFFIFLQVGLAGCGRTIAHKLAQSDLAPSLFRAASDLPRGELPNFLADWQKKLKVQLILDPNGLLGRKYLAVARNISTNFPSIDVLLRYACPITSWTTDAVPDTSQWNFCQPNISAIALLCEKSFLWGSSGQIVDRFWKNVWKGVVVWYLLKVCIYYDRLILFLSPPLGSRSEHRYQALCQWISVRRVLYPFRHPSHLPSKTWPWWSINPCERKWLCGQDLFLHPYSWYHR